MHFSDSEDETIDDGSSNKKLCIELRTGAKQLQISVNLASMDDEDKEWENWLFEDIAVKVGACPQLYWVHEMYSRRDTDGEFRRVCIPYQDYPDKFYKYFRMSVATFDYVLDSIRTRIIKQLNRPSISLRERLAVTLRYLSTGMTFQSLSDSFLMSPFTVSLIVNEVCSVIYEELVNKHLAVPTLSNFKRITDEYEDLWNFPNVIGAIDGKHIQIQCPPNLGSMFCNYKRFYSIVLQAVADSRCKFIFIDVGAYGRQGDAGTFAASSLDAFIQDYSNFPKDSNVTGVKYRVPYLFVCDNAYPLRWNMLKPYPGAPLTPAQCIFNGHLSQTRRCVECAFGILANKWRLLLGDIETGVESACTIVKCACTLHNVIIDKEGVDKVLLEKVEKKLQENDKKGSLHTACKYNRSSVAAEKLRQALTAYFVSEEGSVPWQERYVK